MSIRKAGALFLVAAALPFPTSAWAQDRDDLSIDRILQDLDQDRPAAATEVEAASLDDGTVAAKTNVDFQAALGAAYTSNAALAEDNEVDDFHLTSTGRVDFSHTPAHAADSRHVTFGLRAQATSDDFAEYDDFTNSFLAFRARVDVIPGRPGFTWYAAYAPRLQYAGTFTGYDRTIHDFTIGARREWTLSNGMKIELDAFAMRREATVATAEQFRGSATVTASGGLLPQFAWFLEPNIQGRFYTGGTNDGRDDHSLSLTAGIKWSPIRAPTAAVKLSTSVERSDSNFADRDYFVWNVGLTAAFGF